MFNKFIQDYGLETTDPEMVPRGPRFTVLPEDTIYEPFLYEPVEAWYNRGEEERPESVELRCDADAYPPAEYRWLREANGVVSRYK